MAHQAQNIVSKRQYRLIRKADLLKKVPFSKSMLALRLNPKSPYHDPTLPVPTYFPGSRIPYWDEPEVDAWIATAAARTVGKNDSGQISLAPTAPPVQDGASLALTRDPTTKDRVATRIARRSRVTGPITTQQPNQISAVTTAPYTASEDRQAPPAAASACLSYDDYVVTLPAEQAAPQHSTSLRCNRADEQPALSQPGTALPRYSTALQRTDTRVHYQPPTSNIEPPVNTIPARFGSGNRYPQLAVNAVDASIERRECDADNPTQFAGHSMGAVPDLWHPDSVQSTPSYMSPAAQYEGQPADQRAAWNRPVSPADGWCYV